MITETRLVSQPRRVVRPVSTEPAPWIRLARAADRPLLEAMHRRCSLASRYHRWHAPLATMPEAYLAGAIAGSAEHIALVAVRGRPAREIVAIASAVRHGVAGWELGILVEDRYQRRGLGGALMAALLCAIPADRRGYLQADLLTGRAALLAQLGRLGPVRLDWTDESVRARVDLRAGRPQPAENCPVR